LLNGLMWQYADNGLVAVSDYNMARFFKNYAKDFLATNNNNLDNINGFHHIPTGIDPFTKELIVECPGFIYSNYADVLPSYSGVVPSYATSIINRFDIYDQLQKTMSFSFEENKWGQNYNYGAEFYEYINNTMIGFKNGDAYIHNSNTTNWNRFYGVDQPMRICGVANLNSSLLRDLANIAIEGNAAPNFTVAMANYPNEQITDLSDEDYTNQQGNFYADFFKDRLSPNVSGTAVDKMYSGDQLTDIAIFWMVEIAAYSDLVWVDAVNLGWQVSRGQASIANTINK
jgi:hypothetical protein